MYVCMYECIYVYIYTHCHILIIFSSHTEYFQTNVFIHLVIYSFIYSFIDPVISYV